MSLSYQNNTMQKDNINIRALLKEELIKMKHGSLVAG
jgi:hypothetical protein